MNPIQASELLERAAASVTPSEADPVSRMVVLGKRSVKRRRAWKGAGAVAAAVAVVVALPFATVVSNRLDSVGPHGTVSFGGLSIVVPKGWRASRVKTVDLCTAKPHTVYLAEEWSDSAPPVDAPGSPPYRCASEGQAWMVVVSNGVIGFLQPEQLVSRDGQLVDFEEETGPSGATYRAFNREDLATGVFLPGGEKGREQLLENVTWPAGPPAPPAGGLVLPDHITVAVSEDDGLMVNASDAKTLNRIRTELAKLREPVPAGEECTLRKPGRVGIALGNDLTVVLGDAKCPQAVSTGGGRVRVPAGLGKELLGLIAASDRAAAAAAHPKKS